jgi:hypothetical protein
VCTITEVQAALTKAKLALPASDDTTRVATFSRFPAVLHGIAGRADPGRTGETPDEQPL